MKKIYYEKVGRRYRPVSEYDNDLLDSFSKGSHLVMVYPGGTTRHFNIDPNYAALIAAARVARQPMHEAINEAAKMHREKYNNTVLTNEQLAAWEHFVKAMGERGRYVHYNSVYDIAQAGITAIEQEAAKLMTHPAVQDAFEQFQMVCKLTKESHDSP